MTTVGTALKPPFATTEDGQFSAPWVAVLHALVPTVAGVLLMPYRTSLAANAVGGVSWPVVAVTIGYWGGGSVNSAAGSAARMPFLGMVFLSIASITVLMKRYRHAAPATRG